jgi:hypothetical protein
LFKLLPWGLVLKVRAAFSGSACLKGARLLFLYLDESGNYVFSKRGSEFLIFTALATDNPYTLQYQLCELEKRLRKGKVMPVESECFHATEDKQAVRDEVFSVLKGCAGFTVDSVIVEKNKTNPSLREEAALYKKAYHSLLGYIFQKYQNVEKVLIFIDAAPVKKQRHAFEKGIKESLSEILDKERIGKEIKYYIQYLPTVSSYGLQAVDYCSWALKKKWGDWGEKIDLRPYNSIVDKVKSELEVLKAGKTKYY